MIGSTRQRARVGWLAAGLLALAGCQGMGGGVADGRDPFYGVNGPPSLRDNPKPPVPVASGDRAAPVPPLPAPASTTSPAALATGVTGTLDPGRDLRIGNPPVPEPGGAWKGGQTTQPTVLLRQPESIPAGAETSAGSATYGPTYSGPGPGVTLTSNAGSPAPATLPADDYRQLQQQLTSRGVTAQRLEKSVDGAWRFWCTFAADPKRPTERQVIEVTADTDVAALRAAIQRIDSGR